MSVTAPLNKKKIRCSMQVEVDLTTVPRFHHLWFSRTCVQVVAKQHTSVTVMMQGENEPFILPYDCVFPLRRRNSASTEKWRLGNQVQVTEQKTGLQVWWEATIVSITASVGVGVKFTSTGEIRQCEMDDLRPADVNQYVRFVMVSQPEPSKIPYPRHSHWPVWCKLVDDPLGHCFQGRGELSAEMSERVRLARAILSYPHIDELRGYFWTANVEDALRNIFASPPLIAHLANQSRKSDVQKVVCGEARCTDPVGLIGVAVFIPEEQEDCRVLLLRLGFARDHPIDSFESLCRKHGVDMGSFPRWKDMATKNAAMQKALKMWKGIVPQILRGQWKKETPEEMDATSTFAHLCQMMHQAESTVNSTPGDELGLEDLGVELNMVSDEDPDARSLVPIVPLDWLTAHQSDFFGLHMNDHNDDLNAMERAGAVTQSRDRGWKVDDQVSVCLTDLPGYHDYQFCHAEGKIEIIDNDEYTVAFPQLRLKARVKHDRLAIVRAAEEGVEWSPGQHVHVLETNYGVASWWEATIVKKCGNEWQIKWAGEYEGHRDTKKVPGTKIRSAN